MQSVAQSDPDGYNFVISSSGALIIAPIVSPKLGYDTLRDLTNVAYVAGSPHRLHGEPRAGREDAARSRRAREEERRSR